MTQAEPTLTVVNPGHLTTVQDPGRFGLGALGIGPSGAADLESYYLVNRILANDSDAAALETTLGGLSLHTNANVMIALSGARCPNLPHNSIIHLTAGSTISLAAPSAGLRTYVGVRGGILVPKVLGSRSTDILAGLGPAPLKAGAILPIGRPPLQSPNIDLVPRADPASGEIRVNVSPGPRRDWFTPAAWEQLLSKPYEVTSESNRIGLRLDGAELERVRSGELPSEGILRGALEVPPSGKPILFLADYPVTVGYPVIGYVSKLDVDACGQLRPGQSVRFGGRRGE